MKEITLGFSPCPNDTFIFDALVHGKVNTRGLQFNYCLEDVETLNQWAIEGKLDVTKLSFAALLCVTENYALLHSGSALGKGVGPLLIAAKPFSTAEIADLKIAIPGINTTANLLCSLAFPEAKNKTEILFSNIENEVLNENFDAGLVIHESRFTYAAKGLHKIIDLGDWWEQKTNAPIPLGGIAAKRTLGKETLQTLDLVLKESIAFAWKNYPALSQFVTKNAQEMKEEVMRQHIELYVNDFTTELGTEGRKAIDCLSQEAVKSGIAAGNFSAASMFY